MTEPEVAATPSKRISAYLYFGSLYFISVGVLYLWGYWPPFGVNILEYFTLADVVKAAAYPVASFFVSSVIGVVVAQITGLSRTFPPGGGADTPTGRILKKALPFIVVLWALIAGMVLMFAPVQKWLVLPFWFAIPVAVATERAGLLRQEVRSYAIRSTAIVLLSLLPGLAYGRGVMLAHEILTGQRYTYVVSGLPGSALEVPVEKRLRLVGHAGDYAFLFDPVTHWLTIFRVTDGTGMVLGRYDFQSAKTP